MYWKSPELLVVVDSEQFNRSSTVKKVNRLVLNDLEKAKIALALHFRVIF